MKIAVIGRGSAGCLAAAEITQGFPEHQLYHIYDPTVPIIGVGEGTLPGMPMTLARLTSLTSSVIESRLAATKKYGIQFEGWGTSQSSFFNHFYPRGETFGYHLSASSLVELLSEYINAIHIRDSVVEIRREGLTATLTFMEGSSLNVDFVIDARGFPQRLDPQNHIEIQFIPTNTAIIRRVEQREFISATRAVARPHGWVFVIPLQTHTSYGYIFNRNISEPEEVNRNFDEFMKAERVDSFESRGLIPFPNFICSKLYDGVVARVGNAGGFMEPLEATALALIEHQLKTIIPRRLRRPRISVEDDAVVINRHLMRRSWRYALFISWHYASGSIYDTPFWKFAREHAFHHKIGETENFGIDGQAERELFNQFLYAGLALSDDSKKASLPTLPSFGGFAVENFADMANGLGYC
jgi:tryptophan halogenase